MDTCDAACAGALVSDIDLSLTPELARTVLPVLDGKSGLGSRAEHVDS